MSDNLREILDIARREAPDVADDAWTRIESAIRQRFGGDSPYIASQKKRQLLQSLAKKHQDDKLHALAEKLGVSVRRLRQLQRLG